MKKYYILLTFALISCFGFAQNYEFGIVHISNYDFKVVAIPDFTSTGNTDISDVGFSIALPAGSVDVVNATVSLPTRTGTVQEHDAAFLTGLNLGDGTKDVFQFNIPPGQTLLTHISGEQIDIFSFQITNMPTTDQMYLLLNTDPIAMGAGGVLDSFYNANIDATSTQDYFSMPASGLDSFVFSTLSIEENIFDDNTFQIYPNPTKGKLHISGDVTKLKSINIYSITGQHIMSIKDNFREVNIEVLHTAIYIVKLNTLKTTTIFRVVKE